MAIYTLLPGPDCCGPNFTIGRFCCGLHQMQKTMKESGIRNFPKRYSSRGVTPLMPMEQRVENIWSGSEHKKKGYFWSETIRVTITTTMKRRDGGTKETM